MADRGVWVSLVDPGGTQEAMAEQGAGWPGWIQGLRRPCGSGSMGGHGGPGDSGGHGGSGSLVAQVDQGLSEPWWIRGLGGHGGGGSMEEP